MTPLERFDVMVAEFDAEYRARHRDNLRTTSLMVELNRMAGSPDRFLFLYGRKIAEWTPTDDGLTLKFFSLTDDEAQAMTDHVEFLLTYIARLDGKLASRSGD